MFSCTPLPKDLSAIQSSYTLMASLHWWDFLYCDQCCVPDPGSGAFLTPRSGSEISFFRILDPDSESRILDPTHNNISTFALVRKSIKNIQHLNIFWIADLPREIVPVKFSRIYFFLYCLPGCWWTLTRRRWSPPSSPLSSTLLLQVCLSRGRILGPNPDKSRRSFPHCYSKSPLQLCLEIYICSKSRNLLKFLHSVTEHCKGERRKTWLKTTPPSKKSIQKPQVWELSRLCPESQKPQRILLPVKWIQILLGQCVRIQDGQMRKRKIELPDLKN